ncbi:hypothetical protein [Streptococcus parauberis]|uniref:ABC transporter permease n=1 Tax=Streptococcus parauberis KRS-02083 TaxID=1207545 RepID=A0ABN0IPJ8_9STRE|nr:hypothetical protein [Streptococcus parauberis]AUT06785.1 hypothetical protein SPSF3K_02077 [Streptococcus parauberis]EMG24730.1 hypothetical protein SPJ1_1989 [Streptococcus parauberis KRS-02083]KYP17172.1 hypothetical protein TN39_02085 [Streptococcus parauberis]KYP17185.1 hypothetical protein AKL14_01609 [Streptococcus parauberis]KYP17406.1 hypothetical protein AKL13_02076 [Streptococcus parauberis]
MEKMKKKEVTYAYTDSFFEEGHYLLKIKQTFYALFGWVFFILPTFITVSSYIFFVSQHQLGWGIWSYQEGIKLVSFLIVLFIFAAFMTMIYTVTMTIVQNNRRESFVEKWPTYDSVSSIERQEKASQFMEDRFGKEDYRINVRYYDVMPEKNLANNELANVINNKE